MFQFRAFRDDDDGAVVVDWVVLTAAIIGLGFIAAGTIGASVAGKSTEVASAIVGSEEYNEASTEEFLNSYRPVSPAHGSGWAKAAYDRTKTMTDRQVQDRYNRAYQRASAGNSPRAADRAAVFERALADRGIDRPSGNQPASALRGNYI